MSDDHRLFDTQPLLPPVDGTTREGRPVSKRTLAQRESERRRLMSMHARFGHASDGTICRDCRFLRRFRQANTWLKCERYGVTRSEASDWRAKWPACGAFQREKADGV